MGTEKCRWGLTSSSSEDEHAQISRASVVETIGQGCCGVLGVRSRSSVRIRSRSWRLMAATNAA